MCEPKSIAMEVREDLKDIRPGDRVYVDTVLNGDRIFAKSIRVTSNQPQGRLAGKWSPTTRVAIFLPYTSRFPLTR